MACLISYVIAQRFGYEVAEALKLAGSSAEAANVYAEYCKDIDEAVTCLCEGGLFVEAARAAHAASRCVSCSLCLCVRVCVIVPGLRGQ